MTFIFISVFLMLFLVFGGVIIIEVARIRQLLEMRNSNSASSVSSKAKKSSSRR